VLESLVPDISYSIGKPTCIPDSGIAMLATLLTAPGLFVHLVLMGSRKIFFFSLSALGIEFRASLLLGKCSST
jgi:hypothetical protein